MEESLLQQFWEREEAAIHTARQRYGALLTGLCRNILNDARDAEECVNDTLLVLWNTIPPQRPQSLTAYACAVARKLALHRRRDATAQKRDLRALQPLEELAGSLAGCDLQEQLDARQLADLLNHWLERQTRADRLLFVRRYWFGDSVSCCAELAGLSEAAAYQRLSRLRKKLKTILEQEGFHL